MLVMVVVNEKLRSYGFVDVGVNDYNIL